MPSKRITFPAIGTHWTIEILSYSPADTEHRIKDRIEAFDEVYSRFRKDSLVWKISQKKGEYNFPPDSFELFSLYDKLYKITEGAFTLLIGQTLSQAGYDDKYSFSAKKLTGLPKPEDIFEFDYPVLKVKKPHLLDFGGLGKGYLIDIISNLLIMDGIESFIIDAGGDIYCHNLDRPLRIGLENPKKNNEVIGVVEISHGSICASAGDKRKWGNYHHIFDANSLESSNKILASWAVAKNALTADAMATCLFLVNPGLLQKHFKFEYLVLDNDFKIDRSEGFKGELFYKS